MNTDKRRILLVLGGLALIAILVVGAIELATDSRPAEEPSQPPAVQSNETANEQFVNPPATGPSGQTSSTATGPVAAAGDQELPRTGAEPQVYVLALSLLILSAVAYLRSRKRLHQGLLSVR